MTQPQLSVREKAREIFEQKYPNLYPLIKDPIDQIITLAQEDIIKWANKRCEDNITTHGTDKWNSDLEDLVYNLSKEKENGL